jgi:hypothetical protein
MRMDRNVASEQIISANVNTFIGRLGRHGAMTDQVARLCTFVIPFRGQEDLKLLLELQLRLDFAHLPFSLSKSHLLERKTGIAPLL